MEDKYSVSYISHYTKQVFAVCGIKLLNST